MLQTLLPMRDEYKYSIYIDTYLCTYFTKFDLIPVQSFSKVSALHKNQIMILHGTHKKQTKIRLDK